MTNTEERAAVKHTYYRLPDLMTIASEEERHAIDGPVEFELTFTGVVLEYDDVVVCGCNYPNRGEDEVCAGCEGSLEGLERLRFWKMYPNMEDVDLSVKPLDVEEYSTR